MPDSQPLNPSHVTEGSVVVLPAYPALFTLLGLAFSFQQSTRTTSNAFDTAKFVLEWTGHPMRAWGVLFLLVAAVEWSALRRERRPVFKALLIVGAGTCGGWCGMLLWSALSDPFVSFIGAILFAFAAVCHVASIRSLTRDLVFKGTRP